MTRSGKAMLVGTLLGMAFASMVNATIVSNPAMQTALTVIGAGIGLALGRMVGWSKP